MPEKFGRVIPFYGATDGALFEIERRTMDRDGHVLAAIDALLPGGVVLDTGAGDGFTVERLTRSDRLVLAIEPAAGMIDQRRPLPWVRAAAQALPFRDHSIDAAYATWAYFFPDIGYGEPGLAEWHRVVRPGGPLIVADNAGHDAFSALDDDPVETAHTRAWWAAHGFREEIVETTFRFDSIEEARHPLGFYVGERGRAWDALTIPYRVSLFIGVAGGAGESS
ncbi:MAG: class I SAM-dependent methyltransferase [Chloroflexota bacterium]|nr:class I SAM-dependent methyltransferase [Chloroflexota bacterium]